MNDILAGILSIIDKQAINIIQILVTILYLVIIRRFNITSTTTARLGLFLLGVALIGNLIQKDDVAGFLAGYVVITFIIAIAQQTYYLISSENVEKPNQ